MPNLPEDAAHSRSQPPADDPLLSAAPCSDKTSAPASHFPRHNRFQSGYPLGTIGRGLLVVASLLLLAGFGLSGRLSPDPRGHGTHQQLGLAPCTFLLLTGKPCPSCGGTTAFAHFVRGQWPSAIRANAAAFVLALACAVLVPWCWASAARGQLIGITHPERPLLLFVVTMSILFVLQWGVNLLAYD